jgi:cation transport ATPase
MKMLGTLATVQLGLGVAGLAKALKDGTAYDIGFLRGSPDTISRDQWITGTNLSAPGVMLCIQAAATALLGTRHRRTAARTLGILGVIMSLGYPLERSVRHAWRRRDPIVAPLAGLGTILAAAMAVLGLRHRAP